MNYLIAVHDFAPITHPPRLFPPHTHDSCLALHTPLSSPTTCAMAPSANSTNPSHDNSPDFNARDTQKTHLKHQHETRYQDPSRPYITRQAPIGAWHWEYPVWKTHQHPSSRLIFDSACLLVAWRDIRRQAHFPPFVYQDPSPYPLVRIYISRNPCCKHYNSCSFDLAIN